MIIEIKPKALRKFWESDGEYTKGLPADQLKRLYLMLTHLDTACSLADIAAGLGERLYHHKLAGHPDRYAMRVNGNDRMVYDCHCQSKGTVTIVFLGDYH